LHRCTKIKHGNETKMTDPQKITHGKQDFIQQFSVMKKILSRAYLIAAVILLLLYLSTCVRQVKVQETGLLLRLGKVVRSHIDPGICIKFPWPIDELVTVRTRSVETIQAGFGADPQQVEDFERAFGPIDQLAHGTLTVPYIITGDKNILHLRVLVNYMISDPAVYLFEISEPSRQLGLMVQKVILNSVSVKTVDELLVSGRIELRDLVVRELREFLKKNNLGVNIMSVEIRNVRPPRTTIHAFNDVTNAREESREIVHQAEAYARRIIPEARAEAQKAVTDAEAYRNRIIETAKGESGRFKLLLSEYEKYPDVTRERLRQDVLADVYPSLTKYILERNPDGSYPARLRVMSNSKTEKDS
jgi:modulator of FtsH protease HflK